MELGQLINIECISLIKKKKYNPCEKQKYKSANDLRLIS